MSLELITPATADPVTLAQIKAHLRLDPAETDADTELLQFQEAAREQLERLAGISFLTQTLRWTTRLSQAATWPAQASLILPRAPVTAVTELLLLPSADSGDGHWQMLPAADYTLLPGLPGEVLFHTAPQQADRLRITFAAGWSMAEDIPAPLIQALLLLIAHYHERREPYENDRINAVPASVQALIAPWRRVQL
ncbi:MAG: hypothetical protein MRY59_08995 [Aquisalinus sp.]|nr:hypothetical protein [Aquisalinus sp.]